MWNLSNFTEWIIQAICSFIVLCLTIALLFPEKKATIKKKVITPSDNAGGRRRRINSLLALEPEEVKYEEDYIQVTVTKPEPPQKPKTEQRIIDDAISSLRNVGFLMRDAKAAVLKACDNKVFTDCESLIKAALTKPQWK